MALAEDFQNMAVNIVGVFSTDYVYRRINKEDAEFDPVEDEWLGAVEELYPVVASPPLDARRYFAGLGGSDIEAEDVVVLLPAKDLGFVPDPGDTIYFDAESNPPSDERMITEASPVEAPGHVPAIYRLVIGRGTASGNQS